MSDVKRPYCSKDQEITHDDGFGCTEDEVHEQERVDCEKTFIFTANIYFCYEANKADCLNGAKHSYEATRAYPKEFTEMRCIYCGLVRKPTETEMKTILDSSKESEL